MERGRDVCYITIKGETIICCKEDENCKACDIYKTEIEGKPREELGKKFSYVCSIGKLNDKIRIPTTDDGAAIHRSGLGGGGSRSEM
jgi:hypothetical protein